MTQPKLPVLGGGERELREGDRVRLANDAVLPVGYLTVNGVPLATKPFINTDFYDSDGSYLGWRYDGSAVCDNPALDIVLILGPAEETHGDYVSRVMTVIGKGRPKDLDRVIGFSTPLIPDNLESDFTREGSITLRKPVPSPTYTEKLRDWLEQKRCQLPLNAMKLWRVAGGWRFDDTTNLAVEIDWNRQVDFALGPLPPWQPGDETTIDLAMVREAAEVRK